MLHDGVSIATIDDKEVVIIRVPKADRSEKPVQVYDRKSKQFVAYVRRGENDFHATEDDLRLMSFDSVPGADRKPLDRFGISSLCDETIAHYRSVFSGRMPQSPWNKDSKEDFLYHIGALVKGHDGELHPTQAGLLAFGYEYEITNYLPQYLLDYREEAESDNRWADRIVSQSGDWSGNVIDFYYRVTERLLNQFKAPFTSDETGTVHGVGNPVTEAVNELVANALIHADYGTSSGFGIRIILKTESLSAHNPGTLLLEHDVAIAGGFSETRNPTLMRIFNFIGASDRAGSGLEKVYATWNDIYNVSPTLSELYAPSLVCLSLPLEAPSSLGRGGEARASAFTLDELLGLFESSEEGLTPFDVQSSANVSERVAQKRLRHAYDKGLLSRVKEGRTYRYRLI